MVARAIGVIFVKFLTVTLTVTFFCLIFFIKCCFISIGTKKQSVNPLLGSAHLFTDGIKVGIHRCFNDQFIVYMTNDKAVGESTHGMAEDITADCLYDIFYEFWTIGLDAFPLLISTDNLICDRFATEFIFNDFGFYIAETSAGRKDDK